MSVIYGNNAFLGVIHFFWGSNDQETLKHRPLPDPNWDRRSRSEGFAAGAEAASSDRMPPEQEALSLW